MARIESLLREAKELKALPHSAVRLSELLSHADWALKEIVQVVQHDLVLTGKLLQLANSSTMAATRPVRSVDEAIVRVGPGPLLTLALASAVRMELQRPLEAYGLGERALWQHSVATALAVDQASAVCRALPPAGAFVAGLLHDAGKLILDRHLERPAQGARADGAGIGEDEELRQLGTNHCMIGGLIASHWRLPGNVTAAIAHHHDPSSLEDEVERLTACFVALGDHVAHQVTGTGARPISPYVLEGVEIEPAGLVALCEATTQALRDMLELYS